MVERLLMQPLPLSPREITVPYVSEPEESGCVTLIPPGKREVSKGYPNRLRYPGHNIVLKKERGEEGKGGKVPTTMVP